MAGMLFLSLPVSHRTPLLNHFGVKTPDNCNVIEKTANFLKTPSTLPEMPQQMGILGKTICTGNHINIFFLFQYPVQDEIIDTLKQTYAEQFSKVIFRNMNNISLL